MTDDATDNNLCIIPMPLLTGLAGIGAELAIVVVTVAAALGASRGDGVRCTAIIALGAVGRLPRGLPRTRIAVAGGLCRLTVGGSNTPSSEAADTSRRGARRTRPVLCWLFAPSSTVLDGMVTEKSLSESDKD